MLASIETDKAAVDFEMQEDGYIAKLLYPEGAKDIPLGTLIAIVVDNEKDVAAFANYSADSSAASSTPLEPANQTQVEPSKKQSFQ